ncbi:MAG: phosphopantetheine-binding protein, partial [Mycobacterium sp.]|uniref:phosphopantetheine-binding protein n=1 Tax=Mycobacterium sp. TaxID=1785 RepID=UPI003F9C19DA
MDLLDGDPPARPDGRGNRAVLARPATKPMLDLAPTPVEHILSGIYAQVLGVDRVGVDESFFDLGGDSLSAMRAIAAINTALDTHLAVVTLFDAPSVRSFSQQLSRDASSVEDLPAVSPAGDL